MNHFIRGLGDWLLEICNGTVAKFKTLKPEKEYSEIYYKGKRIIRKSGFPQGLPFSPLLSIWALDWTGFTNREGLKQFADDGGIQQETPSPIELFNKKTDIIGVELADKPYGWTQRFKFLGINWDLKEGTVNFEDKTLKLTIENEEEILKLLRYSRYEDTQKKSDMKINDLSIFWRHMKEDAESNITSIFAHPFDEEMKEKDWNKWYNGESSRAFSYLQSILVSKSSHKIVKGRYYQASDKAKSWYEIKIKNKCMILRSPTWGHAGEENKYLEESIKNKKTFNYFDTLR